MKTYTTSKENLKSILKEFKIRDVKVIKTQRYGGGFWLSRGQGNLPLWVRKSDVGTTKSLKQYIREALKWQTKI